MRLALVAAVVAAARPAAASPCVRVYEDPDNPSITEGETVIDGDPAAIYQAMLDYAKWTKIFPDVARVVIRQRQGTEAMVTLIAPDGHRDNLHFKNQPAARMVYFEDTGGRAEVWVETVFVPGPTAGTTRVHTRLYADVHGLAKLFANGTALRKLREQRIESDLVSIRGYFRRR